MRLVAAVAALANVLGAQPLALHPENPHYFLFRGRPAILVTFGEHYGAVLNLYNALNPVNHTRPASGDINNVNYGLITGSAAARQLQIGGRMAF